MNGWLIHVGVDDVPVEYFNDAIHVGIQSGIVKIGGNVDSQIREYLRGNVVESELGLNHCGHRSLLLLKSHLSVAAQIARQYQRNGKITRRVFLATDKKVELTRRQRRGYDSVLSV